MTYFVWGGDSTNSLDKQIVSYIKDIYRYNDIAEHTKNYTLSSWYNNWTTMILRYI